MNRATQLIEAPNAEDIARIEAQRKWVRQHYEPDAEYLYEALDEKLRLLHTIISSDWIEAHETVKLQSLGITLGDAFIQKLGMRWVAVEEDGDRSPAIELPGTTIILFPLTMISKRIERGEKVDVYELFDGVCDRVQEIALIADRKPKS